MSTVMAEVTRIIDPVEITILGEKVEIRNIDKGSRFPTGPITEKEVLCFAGIYCFWLPKSATIIYGIKS